MNSRNVVVLFVCLYYLAGTIGWAQDNRASLGGRVIDQQQAVIPGAGVLVTSLDTRVQQRTTTNNVGEWRVLFLNPGHYSIAVSAQGFTAVEQSNIEVQTPNVKQIDVTLTLGATTE